MAIGSIRMMTYNDGIMTILLSALMTTPLDARHTLSKYDATTDAWDEERGTSCWPFHFRVCLIVP